ncbi:7923_t:CDS:2 [Cetraspora pellucida]|uniref:7923_t:CDS:1 n=1 Tax=Cetraspora pellucida TaxID=1433469 RepID=A0ACA9KQ32_9GLOM|nr:7923_t:CDS:2 [Cetraspora pellucida]
MSQWPVLSLLQKFQNPVPQFVLGCLPAVAIIGATPEKGFMNKILWMMRCLGCPFTGLLYVLTVLTAKDKDVSMFAYWLPSNKFNTSKRPFGWHAKKISIISTTTIKECIEKASVLAEASVLERLSSAVSAYYVIVGILSGIYRIFGPSACNDWPYVSVLLSWTMIALLMRAFYGKLIVKSPNCAFNDKINVDVTDERVKRVGYAIIIIAVFLSTIFPWISVFIAYYTPPVGFGNDEVHIRTDNEEGNDGNVTNTHNIINAIFCSFGIIVGGLLIYLGLLCNNRSWWVSTFGTACESNNCIIIE